MKKPALIIELVGPPGAGKSTLAEALRRHEGVVESGFPDIRDKGNLPFFIGNGFNLLPTFYDLFWKNHNSRLTQQELVYVIILKGWARVLKRQAAIKERVMVLDQGPVYMMAGLLRNHPEILTSKVGKTWWRQVYKQWSDTLDAVICLDAPDQTLIQRIRKREKQHGIKTNSDEKAVQYLTTHRSAQKNVIFALMSNSKASHVLSFDTTQMALDKIVTTTLQFLNEIKLYNVDNQ